MKANQILKRLNEGEKIGYVSNDYPGKCYELLIFKKGQYYFETGSPFDPREVTIVSPLRAIKIARMLLVEE
ncbi:MAG: hypothetical protein ACYC97_12395 [Metallibacterium sp.]